MIRSIRKTNRYEHMTLYDVIGADKHEGAYGPIHDFAKGVPHDGWYEIRVLAEAFNREHPYDDEFLGTDRTEPLRLGIVAGHQDAGTLHLPQPVEPLLAEIELADEPALVHRPCLARSGIHAAVYVSKRPDGCPESLDSVDQKVSR